MGERAEQEPKERKRFLLRLNPELHTTLERWAADELRSLNGHIEFLLQEAVRAAGRGRSKR
ncbi:MAG: toxin-antitoxin system HicB family antitoxin [Actinomycetota bacterium]